MVLVHSACTLLFCFDLLKSDGTLVNNRNSSGLCANSSTLATIQDAVDIYLHGCPINVDVTFPVGRRRRPMEISGVFMMPSSSSSKKFELLFFAPSRRLTWSHLLCISSRQQQQRQWVLGIAMILSLIISVVVVVVVVVALGAVKAVEKQQMTVSKRAETDNNL